MVNMRLLGAGSQHAAAQTYVRVRLHDTRLGALRMRARDPRVKNYRLGQPFPLPFIQASTTVLQANERQATSIGQTATQTANATRVLVLGSSIAGMLAAAAVAPYVDEVTILDKDTTLNGGGNDEVLRQVCRFCLTTWACALIHLDSSPCVTMCFT